MRTQVRLPVDGASAMSPRGDGSLGPMRDTILSLPDKPLEVAFVADNPGKWLLHSHMLGHATSGMARIEVA